MRLIEVEKYLKSIIHCMPYLFPGIHFPGNYFPHFPMFDKHEKNWSKKIEFRSKKKISLHARKVFSFPHSKENTFLFSKRALTD